MALMLTIPQIRRLQDAMHINHFNASFWFGDLTQPQVLRSMRLFSDYLLRCRDGSLYTGIAKDLSRRLAEHARGPASRYTRSRLPVTLAWARRVRTWRRALHEERRLKTLSRPEKDALVHDALPQAQRARHER